MFEIFILNYKNLLFDFLGHLSLYYKRQSRLETARARFTSGRRVSVTLTGAAVAAFIDVTLVETDGQPLTAHSVILRAVILYSEIF